MEETPEELLNLLENALYDLGDFSDYEKNFLKSVSPLIKRGKTLSDKQVQFLKHLTERVLEMWELESDEIPF